jgi:hypothetical protein
VAYVRSLAQLARTLGAKVIRVFTGYTTEPEGIGPDWDLCVRAVRECAEVAAEQGIILGVQNHHDVGVGVAAYAELLDEVGHPNCRAMFDPWAPALHGEDLRAWARRLAPRMVQTTLADYIRLPRFAYQPGLVNYRRLDDMIRAVPLGVDGGSDGFAGRRRFYATWPRCVRSQRRRQRKEPDRAAASRWKIQIDGDRRNNAGRDRGKRETESFGKA